MDTNTGKVTVREVARHTSNFYKDNMQGSTHLYPMNLTINYTQTCLHAILYPTIYYPFFCIQCVPHLYYTLMQLHVCLHHTLLLVLTLDSYSMVI
jgi:hypothetical protein